MFCMSGDLAGCQGGPLVHGARAQLKAKSNTGEISHKRQHCCKPTRMGSILPLRAAGCEGEAAGADVLASHT